MCGGREAGMKFGGNLWRSPAPLDYALYGNLHAPTAKVKVPMEKGKVPMEKYSDSFLRNFFVPWRHES